MKIEKIWNDSTRNLILKVNFFNVQEKKWKKALVQISVKGFPAKISILENKLSQSKYLSSGYCEIIAKALKNKKVYLYHIERREYLISTQEVLESPQWDVGEYLFINSFDTCLNLIVQGQSFLRVGGLRSGAKVFTSRKTVNVEIPHLRELSGAEFIELFAHRVAHESEKIGLGEKKGVEFESMHGDEKGSRAKEVTNKVELGEGFKQLRKKLKRRQKMLIKKISESKQNLGSSASSEKVKRHIEAIEECLSYQKDASVLLNEIKSAWKINRESEDIASYLPLLYKKLKGLKRTDEMWTKVLADTQKSLEIVNGFICEIDLAKEGKVPELTIASMAKKAGISIESGTSEGGLTAKKKEMALPFFRYKLFGKISVFVGKSAANNDALTKSARSNDIWFHCVKGTGSHVIVKRGDLNKYEKQCGERKNWQELCGILALFHSEHRKSEGGEVYMTEKRHLRKTKDLPPGKWIVQKAETLFIKYDNTRLQEILQLRE